MHTIYVAGPVPREGSYDYEALYPHLARIAEQAGVGIRLPYRDDLDEMKPRQYARAIIQRIADSDSLVALFDAPGARPTTNLAVAGEAHVAAALGKPVGIVAREPDSLPRMLRGLATLTIRSYDADFGALFRALAEEPGPTPPRR